MSDQEFNEALLALQGELTDPKKNAANSHFKSNYVDLHSLLSTMRPLLTKHKFVLSQHVVADRTGERTDYAIRTTYLHVPTGKMLATDVPLCLDRSGSQAFGSACTYAKRQGIMMLMPMAGEDDDDDGEAAEGRKGNATIRFQAPQQPQGFDNIEVAELASLELKDEAGLKSWSQKAAASKFQGSDKERAKAAALEAARRLGLRK